jgi:hypothetical protein
VSAELAIATERARQSNAARAAFVSDTLRYGRYHAALDGTDLFIGARVYDTVSGLEGEVIDAARENIVVPTAK